MLSSKISALRGKILASLSNHDLSEISTIELDLLMQQLRELYEELDVLKDERRRHHPNPQINIAAKITEEKSAMEERKVEIETHKQPVQKQQPAIHITSDETTLVITEKGRKSNSNTLNDRVDIGASLNEKLKPNSLTEVHRKLSTRPLKDLIDLNKKHVMVNELFAGNSKSYAIAIDEIDACLDFETAQTYLQTHNWDQSSQPVRMLLRLVKQKFAIE